MCGYSVSLSESKKIRDTDIIRMFDRISPVYDRMNRLMSLGMDIRWRRKAVKMLDLFPGAAVLDLASGTGDLALEAFKQQPDIQVIACDPSPAMTEIGRNKLKGRRVEFIRSYGEYLPFSEGSFQRAMMAFGIRNFPDRILALKELFRVITPKGRLVILEMTSRKQTILEWFFGCYFRGIVPLFGALISKNYKAYQYLPKSVDNFPEPINFAGEMMKAGWESVQWFPLAFGVVTIFIAEKR
jgi:demethylmenaquinone methyltransferase/2-methoxy-6-polyprenyl-1,4-benzoquinol methylase